MRRGARRPQHHHPEDNDDAGRTKALAAARALHGKAKTVRIVALPDLPDKGDVSDWLDADPRRAENLLIYVSTRRNGCRSPPSAPSGRHCEK